MNRPTVETPADAPWSFQRRWLLIFIAFAAHVGVVFAMVDRKPVKPRPPAPSLVVTRVTEASELLALRDPTLFALPNRHAFAGQTWLKDPVVTFSRYHWSEPPRLLKAPTDEFGAGFSQFIQANAPSARIFDARPIVASQLSFISEAPEFVAPSSLRFGGKLQERRLLNPPALPSWPATDLLTNSVVRVLVSEVGLVESPPTLETSSGSAEADQFALKAAAAARFSMLPAGVKSADPGVMIFQWQTVPVSGTNKPPGEN
jgi:hypothetical protein